MLDYRVFTRMKVQIRSFYFLLCSISFSHIVSEKVTFINVEHPRVTYFNLDYIKYANLTTSRYGRANPIYYVGLNFEIIVELNKNIYVDIYFFELLTNVYKRSFVEFHYNWCHLVEKDMFFGLAMRQNKMLDKPCPHPPGVYNLLNMTIHPEFIPRGFPFNQGRIYANFSQVKPKARIAEGFIDMKIGRIERTKAAF